MGLGQFIVRWITDRQRRKRLHIQGSLGDFYRAGGGELLTSGLDVTSDEHVIDAGGFEGTWTADMLTRYGCSVLLFEPVPTAAAQLRKRFGQNRRVRIEQFAIGRSVGKMSIDLAGESSSLFTSSGYSDKTVVEVVDVAEVVSNFEEVACLKLNIKGGEYDVLERLLEQGLLARVRNVLVQFHPFVDGHGNRRNAILRSISKTHETVFEFGYIWQLWRRRGLTRP